MDSAKAELADKLKNANNILVTVSRNPSVDQLAACIGLTLLLNKLGKHAAAVFSGQVPSTIEFLKPEDTLEKNTDSLRDFIIALDKSKADKLRYKVEDNVVRIFITPYKTSISQADLEFSQGDFNVDVVVALGVQKQEDLDEAITAHGRILHDATVASVNVITSGELGTINWQDAQASSLSELVTELTQTMGGNLLDNQIATALLTGIVAETDRFSNAKTSSQTMSASAALMAAGANQQLVATKLEEAAPSDDNHDDQSPPSGNLPTDGDDKPPKTDDGTLEINHDASQPDDMPATDQHSDQPNPGQADSTDATAELSLPKLDPSPPIDMPSDDDLEPAADYLTNGSKLMTEPPTMGGMLTANSQPEGMDQTSDPLSSPSTDTDQILDHTNTIMPTVQPPLPQPVAPAVIQPTFPDPIPAVPAIITPTFTPPPLEVPPAPEPQPAPPAPIPTTTPTPFIAGLTPPPPSWVPPNSDPFETAAKAEPKQTLSDIEASVQSPHVAAGANLDLARDEVNRALNANPATPGALESLNAQPLGDILHPTAPSVEPTAPIVPPTPLSTTDLFSTTPPVAVDSSPTPNPFSAPTDTPASAPQVTDPTAPPPVPPPIPFQFRPPGQ